MYYHKKYYTITTQNLTIWHFHFFKSDHININMTITLSKWPYDEFGVPYDTFMVTLHPQCTLMFLTRRPCLYPHPTTKITKGERSQILNWISKSSLSVKSVHDIIWGYRITLFVETPSFVKLNYNLSLFFHRHSRHHNLAYPSDVTTIIAINTTMIAVAVEGTKKKSDGWSHNTSLSSGKLDG